MKSVTVTVPDGKDAKWVNGILTLVDEAPANDNKSILPAWSALEGARFLEGTTAVIYHLNEIRDIIYNPMDHLVWHCKEFAEFAKMR